MKNIMRYKDYYGSVNFDEEGVIFYGKLLFIRALVSYEGETAKEIQQAFHDAVDDYLETCEQEGITPEKPFKGSFNVRVGEELHEQAMIAATEKEISLNDFVKNAIYQAVR